MLPDVIPDLVEDLLLPLGELRPSHFFSIGVDKLLRDWFNHPYGTNAPVVQPTRFQVYHVKAPSGGCRHGRENAVGTARSGRRRRC